MSADDHVRAPVTFTAADIKRVIRAVTSAGLTVARVDFPAQGGFRVLIGPPSPLTPTAAALAEAEGRNEWDRALDL
jgi:hypothetical protein